MNLIGLVHTYTPDGVSSLVRNIRTCPQGFYLGLFLSRCALLRTLEIPRSIAYQSKPALFLPLRLHLSAKCQQQLHFKTKALCLKLRTHSHSRLSVRTWMNLFKT